MAGLTLLPQSQSRLSTSALLLLSFARRSHSDLNTTMAFGPSFVLSSRMTALIDFRQYCTPP